MQSSQMCPDHSRLAGDVNRIESNQNEIRRETNEFRRKFERLCGNLEQTLPTLVQLGKDVKQLHARMDNLTTYAEKSTADQEQYQDEHKATHSTLKWAIGFLGTMILAVISHLLASGGTP